MADSSGQVNRFGFWGEFGTGKSGNGSDLHLELPVFGMEGFLVVELGLEADEKIAWDAEAQLDAQGEVGADSFFLADDVAELCFADFHGLGGLRLSDAVMDDGVADQGGGGV